MKKLSVIKNAVSSIDDGEFYLATENLKRLINDYKNVFEKKKQFLTETYIENELDKFKKIFLNYKNKHEKYI